MVLDYYKLKEQPFGVTPNPRYLFLSETHREAFATVLLGVKENRGFTGFIAPPGMGKTTLLFGLLQKLGSKARTVFLFQPHTSPHELLQGILADLGLETRDLTLIQLQTKLNDLLLQEAANDRQVILVIDEAQNLSEPVLEAVRMLSNFETPERKLMHIVLAGQPQLAETLATGRMAQLRQRISVMARLSPFTAGETKAYMDHRLRVAGYAGKQALFEDEAVLLIAQQSGGIPRNINNLCFNSLNLGLVLKKEVISAQVIREVLGDLDLKPLMNVPGEPDNSGIAAEPVSSTLPALSDPAPLRSRRRWFLPLAAALGIVTVTGGVLWAHHLRRPPHATDLRQVSSAVEMATAAPDAFRNPVSPGARVLATPPADPDPAPDTPKSATPESSGVAGVPQVKVDYVKISRDQTLSGILRERFGKADAATVNEILKLNPWITDLNRIKAGQVLAVPSRAVPAGESPVGPNTGEKLSNLEAGKQ